MKTFLSLLLLLHSGTSFSALLAQHVSPPLKNVQQETSERKSESVDAEFPGGNIALYQFLSRNLIYPEQAVAHNISGKVIVRFMIDKEGTLKKPEIVKGLGYGCDEEVLRVITLSPKWKPARQNGNLINTSIQMPVSFNLMDLPDEDTAADVANLTTPISATPSPDMTYPEFPGGIKKLTKFLIWRLKYPEEKRKKPIHVRVIAEFTIDEQGKPGDFKIIKGAGAAFDREVLRVLRDMPDWKPGTENGKPVKMYYSLPVNFRTQ